MSANITCWFLLVIAPSIAAGWPAAVEGDYVVRNFRFESGETLPELKLHYTALGKPQRDAAGVVSNAVLVLHGTGGSGGRFLSETFAGELFGPGQLLDAARYYVVMPDGIGHGKSSKPSDGLRMRFPHYCYHDMVRAQHQLLSDGLGVNHLRLIIGTSMGAMQTWMWGEMYPDFASALMPLASAPVHIAGRNRIWRRMVMDSIGNDPEWKDGNYTTQPRGLIAANYILMLITSSPAEMQRGSPTRDAADESLRRSLATRLEHADANDMLYAYDASRDYDPAPELEKITAPLVAINSADDEVNPPELGLVEREIRRVKRGRFILLPASEETRGHGTHSLAKLWKRYLAELLAASEARSVAARK